jgi:hypothetical protein
MDKTQMIDICEKIANSRRLKIIHVGGQHVFTSNHQTIVLDKYYFRSMFNEWHVYDSNGSFFGKVLKCENGEDEGYGFN